jgi:hypothetical protein
MLRALKPGILQVVNFSVHKIKSCTHWNKVSIVWNCEAGSMRSIVHTSLAPGVYTSLERLMQLCTILGHAGQNLSATSD